MTRLTAIERFRVKYIVGGEDNACWLWTAQVTGKGYGYFHFEGKSVRAHRWSYEHHVGRIPDGLEIDHTCRVRTCVNPQHLEVVTREENVRRYKALLKTCAQGHAWTDDNTAWEVSRYTGNPVRRCRACWRERDLRHQQRDEPQGTQSTAGKLPLHYHDGRTYVPAMCPICRVRAPESP